MGQAPSIFWVSFTNSLCSNRLYDLSHAGVAAVTITSVNIRQLEFREFRKFLVLWPVFPTPPPVALTSALVVSILRNVPRGPISSWWCDYDSSPLHCLKETAAGSDSYSVASGTAECDSGRRNWLTATETLQNIDGSMLALPVGSHFLVEDIFTLIGQMSSMRLWPRQPKINWAVLGLNLVSLLNRLVKQLRGIHS